MLNIKAFGKSSPLLALVKGYTNLNAIVVEHHRHIFQKREVLDVTADLIIVDDDEGRSSALRSLMEVAGFRVKTYSSPVKFIQQFSPDIGKCVLLELNMRHMSGLDVQQFIRQRGSGIPVILTADADVANVPLAVRAVKAGAFEFLQKPLVAGKILTSVQRALKTATQFGESGRQRLKLEKCFESLTARERHVFMLVVEGASNKQIAIDLSLSEKTVEIHRGRVMHKMDARSVVQLVKISFMLRGAVNEGSLQGAAFEEHDIFDLHQGGKEHAIFTLDRNGWITQWSDSAHRVLGYSAKEVVGKNFSIFFTPEDLVSGEPKRELLRAEIHGLAARNSWRIHRTGKKIWMNGVSSAMRDNSERITGFVRISRDLTDVGMNSWARTSDTRLDLLSLHGKEI